MARLNAIPPFQAVRPALSTGRSASRISRFLSPCKNRWLLLLLPSAMNPAKRSSRIILANGRRGSKVGVFGDWAAEILSMQTSNPIFSIHQEYSKNLAAEKRSEGLHPRRLAHAVSQIVKPS